MYVHNGRVINKYEIVTRVRVPRGIQSTKYYFSNKDDAELYLLFLYQERGEKEINTFLASKRYHQWEKREYMEFKKTINWDELRNAVKDLAFEKEVAFIEIKAKK